MKENIPQEEFNLNEPEMHYSATHNTSFTIPDVIYGDIKTSIAQIENGEYISFEEILKKQK